MDKGFQAFRPLMPKLIFILKTLQYFPAFKGRNKTKPSHQAAKLKFGFALVSTFQHELKVFHSVPIVSYV